jgi:hypothetical protein
MGRASAREIVMQTDFGVESHPRERRSVNQRRVEWPAFVVMSPDRRRFLQERTVAQGFHWESPPFVWVQDVRRATKYPTTIARVAAVEMGGVAIAVSGLAPASPPAP